MTPSRNVAPYVSDRWGKADQQVHGLFPLAVASQWWITPVLELGWLAPIQVWEDGRPSEVETLLRELRHACLTG